MPPFPPLPQPFNGHRSTCRLHRAPPPERVEEAHAVGTRTARPTHSAHAPRPPPPAPSDAPRLPGGRQDGRLRRTASHACGTRLTCAGWAAESGPDPPHPRARASGCLCRGGRSPNHTSRRDAEKRGMKTKKKTNHAHTHKKKKQLGGEKLETRNPRPRRHRVSLFPSGLLPPRPASTHRLQPDARPVRDELSRLRPSGPAGAGPLLSAGIFLSPSKPSRPPPRAQPFPIPASRARGEAPPGADSPRQPGCEYRQLCRCHTG